MGERCSLYAAGVRLRRESLRALDPKYDALLAFATSTASIFGSSAAEFSMTPRKAYCGSILCTGAIFITFRGPRPAGARARAPLCALTGSLASVVAFVRFGGAACKRGVEP